MREYLLYSQIAASRENQVLHILSGVTGTQPTPICEQTLIFQQLRVPEVPANKRTQNKQNQQKQSQLPTYRKLIREVHVKNGETIANPWIYRAEALPEAGITNHISREIDEHEASDSDFQRLNQDDDFRLKRQQLTYGHRFVYENIIIKVSRFVSAPDLAEEPIASPPPPGIREAKLMDPSGSWIIEAAIRVDDGNNSTLTDAAQNELRNFKGLLDGSLDLIAPDRLALDSRVRN